MGIKLQITGWPDAASIARWREVHEQLPAACTQLAEKGWPFPMIFSSREAVEWAQDSPDELDRKFVRLFSANRGARFNALAGTLLERDNLAPWRDLLEECVSVYRRRQYRVAVPALLAILEGILSAGCGNSTRVKAIVEGHLASAPREEHDDLLWVLWSAVDAFIGELFKRVQFSDSRPPVLNRHWILHGRDLQSASWSQSDSLRLFLAIDTASYMLSDEPV